MDKDIQMQVPHVNFRVIELGEWVDTNTKYSELWPNITKKRSSDVPADQEKWRDVEGKLKYFSEKPGKGD